MRGTWLFICVPIGIVGCASEPTNAPEDPAQDHALDIGELGEKGEAARPVPEECAHSVALYGMTGNAQGTPVGPVTVDTTSILICLSLDARDNIQIAHFAAGTQYESGTATSSFELTLYDGNGVMLRDGWDVTFGSSPPTTFANLEYGVTKGTIIDAVLWVRAKNGAATTTIGVTLFEPYE